MRACAVLMVLSCLPGWAEARCVTADDLASGISFTRQDGRQGLVIAEGPGVAINYDTRSEFWVDRRSVAAGVFETVTESWPVDQPSVGDGVTERRFTFAAPLPGAITPGLTYASDVAVEMISHAPVADGPIKRQERRSVQYAALEAREVVLSGCRYQAIPVEASWADDQGRTGFQRWVYFPDLGFSVETKTAAGANGLTRLVPGGQ